MSQEYVLAKNDSKYDRCIIAKHFDGKFYDLADDGKYYQMTSLKEYCSLSDFIKQQEDLEKRIAKLENK